MQRCLQLAAIGQPWVAPNPMVGAVIVNNGIIIGEGYHAKFGEPHAEVNAINSVIDKSQIKGATIYVSLEPCAHFGKTPPCTNLIIEHQLAKVVIACLDPNPLVAGKGVMQLKNAGIEVEIGVLETEAKQLNKRFIYYHQYKLPYVTLKWAQTADGYCGRMAGSKQSRNISNWFSNILVHQLRSAESAILVGYNTALYDNPSLTTRKWFGNNPTRIVIDMEGQLPSSLNLYQNHHQTIVFTLHPSQNTAQVTYIKLSSKQGVIQEILKKLYELKLQSLLVEGGPKTLQMFIDSGLWNEAHIITSNQKWGEGIKAPLLTKGKEVYCQTVLNDYYQVINPEISL